MDRLRGPVAVPHSFHFAGHGPGVRPDLGFVHYLPDPGDAYPDHSAVRQAD